MAEQQKKPPVTIKFVKNGSAKKVSEVTVRTRFKSSPTRHVPLIVDSVIECLSKKALIEALEKLGVPLTRTDKLHRGALTIKLTDAILNDSGSTAGITVTITPG